MKKMIVAALAISLTSVLFISCQDNHAAEKKSTKKTTHSKEESKAAIKTDGPAIGSIETDDYVVKLHRVFQYKPEENAVMANWTPKKGFKFIYLDASLKNKSTAVIDGGFVFIALKVTDMQGVEYKKPATALAAYLTDHPEVQNQKEYDEMWGKFEPNEFHRELIYAVEVPENINQFELSLPTNNQRKEWKKLQFSL
ncbi:MAG TPA: hypothetical protein VJU78_09910 [Chitinophagaceae bacterium]|nr:hypothetical protein [Chitinophagaceae bacterium]